MKEYKPTIIYKYELAIADLPQTVKMPENPIFRYAGEQDGNLCVWAEVDPKAQMREYSFCVKGTGQPISPDMNYIGTVQMSPFVWHIFQITNKS